MEKQENDEAEVVDILCKLGKFNPKKWIEWEKQLWNYLGGLKGHSNVPLQYVIQDPDNPNQNLDNPVWTAPLDNLGFKRDTKTVFTILIESIINTDRYGWV